MSMDTNQTAGRDEWEVPSLEDQLATAKSTIADLRQALAPVSPREREAIEARLDSLKRPKGGGSE